MKKVLLPVLVILFTTAFIGVMSYYTWDTMDKYEEFWFCLDVLYDDITDDPKVMEYCQKIMNKKEAEWAEKDRKRNEEFLKKFEKNN